MEISYRIKKIIMSSIPVERVERARINWLLRGGRTPILVLQMGKVGSSSICDALRCSQIQRKHPVFQVHYLTKSKVLELEDYYKSRKTYVRRHIVVSKILNEKYSNDEINFSNLVTSIREPVGRRISAFFENYPQTHPNLLNYTGDAFIDETVRVLTALLDEEAATLRTYEDQWFETEVHERFGLDVFEARVESAYGFYRMENEQARLLLFKMEELGRSFAGGIEWLTGEKVAIGTRNVGSKKSYSSAYNEVKRKLRIKESVVREILSSKLVETFYADQKEHLFAKWAG